MSYETLLTSRADGVARIVLNRPEVRNVVLSRSLIVLSDAGDKAFCAAADFKEVGRPRRLRASVRPRSA